MEKPERFYCFCERLVFFTPGFEYKTDPIGVVDKIAVFSGDIDAPERRLKQLDRFRQKRSGFYTLSS